MRPWILLLLITCCFVAFANDSRVVGEGGRVRLVDDEKTTVRMVSEAVNIDVRPDTYDVTADFLFKNEGPAVTVSMGFPESGYGDLDGSVYRNKSGFRSFRTWVDGQPVTATRRRAIVEEDGMLYRTFWVKQVAFATGQTRRVKVTYQTVPGIFSTGERFAVYPFTGGNWRGTVAESVLTVTLHTPGTWMVQEPYLPEKPKPVSQRWHGNTFTARWTNWQADGGFSMTYASTYPDWLRVSGLSQYQPERAYRMLTQPGRTATLDWLPPAVLRDGTAFIALDAVADYLNNQGPRNQQQQRARITWNLRTLEATLTVDNRTLNIKLKRNTIEEAGREPVTLPAPPFLSRPGAMNAEGQVYVPLRPLATALGGTAIVDTHAHRITLTLPKPKGE